jgi:hypothetical protein
VTQGLADTLALSGDLWSDRWRVVRPFFDSPPGDVAEWASWLEEFEGQAVDAVDRIRARAVPGGEPGEPGAWAQRLVDQIKAWRGELAAIAPWVNELRACERLEDACWATEQAGKSWAAIRAELSSPASVAVTAGRTARLLAELAELAGSTPDAALIRALMAAVGQSRSAELLNRLRRLVDRAEDLATAMDFRPLYRPENDPDLEVAHLFFDHLGRYLHLVLFRVKQHGKALKKLAIRQVPYLPRELSNRCISRQIIRVLAQFALSV